MKSVDGRGGPNESQHLMPPTQTGATYNASYMTSTQRRSNLKDRLTGARKTFDINYLKEYTGDSDLFQK